MPASESPPPPPLPLLVIVGINGRQGTSVANAFLKAKTYKIRGLTTLPHCPASEKWKALGVEIQEETFTNVNSLRASFKGASVIFASTNFHKHLDCPQAKVAAAVSSGASHLLPYIAEEADFLRGRRIADAAARIPELQHLVLSAYPKALKGSTFTNEYTYYACRASEKVVMYINTLPKLLKKRILVVPLLRMEDFHITLQMSKAGTLSFGTTAPADLQNLWINMTNDFGTYIQILLSKKIPKNLSFWPFSVSMSGAQICAAIAKVSGLPCEYRRYTVEEMVQFYKDQVTGLLPISYQPVPHDQPHITTPILEQSMGKSEGKFPRTTFEEYLEQVLPAHLEALENKDNTASETSKEGEYVFDDQRQEFERQQAEIREAQSIFRTNGQDAMWGISTEEAMEEARREFGLD